MKNICKNDKKSFSINYLAWFLGIALLALPTSCGSPLKGGYATLTIVVSHTDARAAVPSSSTLAELEYAITCTGSAETISRTLESGEAAVTLVLRAGDWALGVEAWLPDPDGPILVGRGSAMVSLRAEQQARVPIEMAFSNAELKSLSVAVGEETYPAQADPSDAESWSAVVARSPGMDRFTVEATAAVDGAELVIDGRNLGTGTVRVAIPFPERDSMDIPIMVIAGADYTQRYTLALRFVDAPQAGP